MSTHEFLKQRAGVVRAIRRFFDEQGFTEMHTPRLVGLPGQEPYLEPLWTNVLEADGTSHRAALITSPEYAMKRLLGDGWDKIYDMGACFRNSEPWDGTHDVEFLLLEWYRRDAGLEELMTDTEAMIRCVLAETKSDIALPSFRRLSVVEAMRQYAGVELEPLIGDREALARVVREHDHTVTEQDTWDDLFFKIFLSEVEPKLGRDDQGNLLPTFLHTYPTSMAALARKHASDPRFALRTELYIGDFELANGFAELCDAVEQRTRFTEEQSLRASLSKDIWAIDERFLEALPRMGDAAGIAFGVDRLVMLITGTRSISEVMPIPVRERF